MKKILFLTFLFASTKLNAQVPTILWEKTFGGGQNNRVYSVIRDDWNNLWVGGRASFDAEISSIDSIGNINWSHSYGGTNGNEKASQIIKNYNGNIVFAGYASSTNGDVIGLHGGTMSGGENDYWVVCLDTIGNIIWQKCLGGTGMNDAMSIQQTSDSGYIDFGHVEDDNGDITTYLGSYDIWIAKISSNGNLQWQKSFGGSAFDLAGKIICTPDGGYAFTGASASLDHHLTINRGSYDVWIVKISSNGIIQWQYSYGGSGSDGANDIVRDFNGNYYLIGNTNSGDFDINNPKGAGDILVMKTDSLGILQWSKCLGGSQNEEGQAGCLTTNGGVEIVGYSYSNDSNLSNNHGLKDAVAFEVDSSGNLLWAKSMGGSNNDEAFSVTQASDGGSIVCGYSLSSDGDIGIPNTGNEQNWIIRLSDIPVGILDNQECKNAVSGEIKNQNLAIRYEFDKDQSVEISVFDMSGKSLIIKKDSFKAGRNKIELPFSFRSGAYILKVVTRDRIFSCKIVCVQ